MRSAMLEALSLNADAAPVALVKPVVWTSEEWVAYFEHNAANLMSIPWDAGVGAAPEELAEIIDSLRAWQLGETSDGSRLTRAAERYAEQTNDHAYVEAVKRFITEEQRHGETLGRFIDLVGVPRKRRDWGDSVFRLFRHLRLRMEVWTTVVIMVEVHAMLYYAAVRRATGSAVLRRVCHQILRDEVPHLRFQCERLAILHRNRGRVLRALTLGGQRLLFFGVTLAVWCAHRRALRAGGFTFRRFWRGAWAQMGKAWRAMDPRGYEWR